MTRTRDIMMGLYASQVQDLESDLASGAPIGIGRNTPGSSFGAIASAAAADLNSARLAHLKAWEDSPYRQIREIYSQSRGVVGELLTRTLFERVFNLEVSPPTVSIDGVTKADTRFDEMVSRLGRCDTKLSTLSVAGTFQWSSINPGDEDYVLLWGIRPASVEGWLVPTPTICELFKLKAAGSPVTGVSLSRHGEYTISFRADCPPVWIEKFGGDQQQLFSRIRSELK